MSTHGEVSRLETQVTDPSAKKAYGSPQLKQVGTLAQLTRGTATTKVSDLPSASSL